MATSATAADFLRLLWGTVAYRPYVYAFFACFLGFALYQWRARRTAAFVVGAYLIAFACEYSATRNGFPFGRYTYIEETRTRELWVSNVPFWDSLSFVFLGYFSWMLAALVRAPGDPQRVVGLPGTACLGGLLMMLLDVVIDPVTLLGNRWFLGNLYFYPQGGAYFGVTLANFAGWWFAGWAISAFGQALARLDGRRGGPPAFRWPARFRAGIAAAYAGVFLFNLGITGYLGVWPLFCASSAVTVGTLSLCAWAYRGRRCLRGNRILGRSLSWGKLYS